MDHLTGIRSFFPLDSRCICDPGFKLDSSGGKKCVDIDECADPNVCTNGGLCRNFPGTFQCTCQPGNVFNPTTRKCEDEDECECESPLLHPTTLCSAINNIFEHVEVENRNGNYNYCNIVFEQL